MSITREDFHYTESPFVLCKPNGDRVGELRVVEKSIVRKFVEYDEINFKTYRLLNHQKNPYYDDIKELMLIELPGIGTYVITELDINAEDDYNESKTCTALSSEVQLAQKFLELFTINMGTTESQDGVQLYNLSDTGHSLLHLVLEKCPDWSIGYINPSLQTVQRSFEVSREDVYSFLTTEMSEAFEAIVVFDTVHHTVNVYKEEQLGEDINVALSYDNLLMTTDISSSTDDIKTCLTVTGDNDLDQREVNLGYDRIYNIDYFHDLSYMSQDLYDAYTAWRAVWENAVVEYQPLSVQRHELVKQKNYLTSEMQPENPPDPTDGLQDEDWTEYSLNGLKEKKAANEQAQAVNMKAGYGEPGNPEGTPEERRKHDMYLEQYLPIYNRIQDIDAEIAVRESQIENVETQIAAVDNEMSEIVISASMTENFTQDQQKELAKFIREDELSSSNYIVTDTMTEDERYEMLQDMQQFGTEELAKVAQPTLEFSVDMANIYLIPEFDGVSDKFIPGNYVYVYQRDDYYIKARILSIEEDLINRENFSVTFGNLMRTKDGKLLEDVTEALKQATSAATSVSFGQSYWNQANREATEISERLERGLLYSGESIRTANSDVQIDDRGIWVYNTSTENNGENNDNGTGDIFIGGGQILFTNDRFKTIRTAQGRCTYTDSEGNQTTDFGLLAQFVIAGYIAGTTIEGSDIHGTHITGGTITGTEINNGNGTFSVNSEGHLTATSVDISGVITSTDIHGGTINIGDGVFTVDEEGNVVANSWTSNNAHITGGSIDIVSSGDNTAVMTVSNDTSKTSYLSNGIVSRYLWTDYQNNPFTDTFTLSHGSIVLQRYAGDYLNGTPASADLQGSITITNVGLILEDNRLNIAGSLSADQLRKLDNVANYYAPVDYGNQVSLSDANIDSGTSIKRIYRSAQMIQVYLYLKAQDNKTLSTISTITIPNAVKCVRQYGVIGVYSAAAPYAPIGSVWFENATTARIYLPSGVTACYISGTYMCDGIE